MELGLTGKSVFVAAASKGLGKASALEFAREGANTIASRNIDQLRQAREEILAATGQEVTIVQMDVFHPEDIQRAIRRPYPRTGAWMSLLRMPEVRQADNSQIWHYADWYVASNFRY